MNWRLRRRRKGFFSRATADLHALHPASRLALSQRKPALVYKVWFAFFQVSARKSLPDTFISSMWPGLPCVNCTGPSGAVPVHTTHPVFCPAAPLHLRLHHMQLRWAAVRPAIQPLPCCAQLTAWPHVFSLNEQNLPEQTRTAPSDVFRFTVHDQNTCKGHPSTSLRQDTTGLSE